MLPYFEDENASKEFYINHWKNVLNWPLHLHSHIELIYVRRGIMSVVIGDEEQVLREGDFAVAFPNCIHGYRRVEGSGPCDVRFYVAFPSMLGDYAEKVLHGVPKSPFVSREYISNDAFTALEMLRHQKEVYNREVARAYMQIVMACLWPQLQVTGHSSSHRDLPSRVLQYVTRHYREPITAESVAKEMGVTKNHLSRVFSSKLYMSFPQYLHFLRMEQAKELLRNTNKSVLDIGYDCGYDSSRTFNRVFLDVCGCSPREYRAKHLDK